MRLIEFSYSDPNWTLQNLEFAKASLIVGKNATGKSRTLRYLGNFLKIIKQTQGTLPVADYQVKFLKENGDILDYWLHIDGGNVYNLPISEKLSVNDRVVLNRTSHKSAEVFNAVSEKIELTNPPANKLVIHSNRDIKKYPFFEDIAKWAEQSFGFKFGSINSEAHNVFDTNLSFLDGAATFYGRLNDNSKDEILEDLREIGFWLDSISVQEGSPIDHLQIMEKGIKPVIEEREISQGMLRSLYLLIFIKYLIGTGQTSTIFIDDFCEGMDYERATKLGKLVFEICEKNKIQLIATSNDMFLMDVVDLEYWNVLQRNGSVVTAINAKKYPELFSNFKYTGLSNFDFFSSDYISQKISK